jgi:sporulation protein YlmC with PRC-barrel domain
MKMLKFTAIALLAVAGLASVSLAAQAPSAHRFSDLKSMNVENNRGDKLGKIEDLIYDPQNGDIDYAIVGMGGFLGMGEKLFAVPVDMLKAQDDTVNKTRRIVMDRDKKSLDGAPGFSPSQWPNLADQNWSAQVDRFYGTERSADGAEARASQLSGMNVENDRGENLGKIDDVVVDMGQHRIGYAAISFGTTLGMGGKLFAVPYSNLRSTREKNSDRFHIVLNADKQQLDKAPGFDKNHWPDVANNAWAADVDTYYRDHMRRANNTAQNSDTAQNNGPSSAKRGPQVAYKSNDLIGVDVYNAQGEKLGTLESLIVEVHSGKIRYGVVGAGGFLGIGEKFFTVPWQSLQVQYDASLQKNQIGWNVDKARLEQAPHFERGNWPNFDDATMASNIDTFYGVQQRRPATLSPARRIQDFVSITVRNQQGDDLGKVEEVVVNPQAGTVQYAALSFGGFLGFGEKLFAVPWAQLQLHEDQKSHNFVAEVNVQKQSLEKAPSFDKDHWPDFADPHWSRDVDLHYGPRVSQR